MRSPRPAQYASLEVEDEDPQYHTCSQCVDDTDLGQLVKTIAMGGSDGVYLCMGVVCGAVGSALSIHHILALGFSGLVALSLGLGVNEFLSVRAHNLYLATERGVNQEALRTHPEEELRAVEEYMLSRGVQAADAREVVQRLAKYETYFLENMLLPVKTQQLMPPQEELRATGPYIAEAFAMFLAVLTVGAAPLIMAAITLAPECSVDSCSASLQRRAIVVFCITSLVLLFMLGGVKSRFYAVPFALAGLENLGIGLICGLAGLGTGVIVSRAL